MNGLSGLLQDIQTVTYEFWLHPLMLQADSVNWDLKCLAVQNRFK